MRGGPPSLHQDLRCATVACMKDSKTVELVLPRGIQGSGKSTFARQWQAEDPTNRVRVSRDDLRLMVFGTYAPEGTREEKFAKEQTVTALEQSLVERSLTSGRSVVVDGTNLAHRFAKEWLRMGKRLDVPVRFVDFNVSLDEALANNRKRAESGGRDVPEDVIRDYYKRFVNRKTGLLHPYPVLDETFEMVTRKYVPNDDLPDAYMFDIDGTLADHTKCGRNPYDLTRVSEDSPVDGVVRLALLLHGLGYRLIFLSGREEICREDTKRWLAKYVLDVDDPSSNSELHMRAEGDTQRKDSVVKLELFDRHVRDKYAVRGVVDDRHQVVQLWYSIGLTLFRVGDPDARF